MTSDELVEEIRAEAWAFIAVDAPLLPLLTPDAQEWIDAGIYFGMAAAVLVLQHHEVIDGGIGEGDYPT